MCQVSSICRAVSVVSESASLDRRHTRKFHLLRSWIQTATRLGHRAHLLFSHPDPFMDSRLHLTACQIDRDKGGTQVLWSLLMFRRLKHTLRSQYQPVFLQAHVLLPGGVTASTRVTGSSCVCCSDTTSCLLVEVSGTPCSLLAAHNICTLLGMIAG